MLFTDGTITTLEGRTLYERSFDPATSVKISQTGEVFWVTRSGLLQSSKRGILNGLTSSGVVSFQVNRKSDVAYLSQSGSVGLNGRWVDLTGPRAVAFQLETNETQVSVIDSDGRIRVYR